MAEETKTLDILIRTVAELTGAKQLEASLESQIGKAKALGNVEELKKLQPQLETVRTSIGTATVAQTDLSGAMEKGGEAAEHSHISHRALHKLFHEIGSVTAPMMGHALTAALYGPVGLAIGLGVAIEGVKRAFEAEEKAAEDFKAAIESGADVGSMTKAAGEFESAVVASATAADTFATAMEKIKSGQVDIKTETDGAVKSLHEEATAWGNVQKARLEAAKADINADTTLAPEEKIRRLAALEGKAADDRQARNKQVRDQELALRQQELIKTAAAAAVAEKAVPAAQDAAERAGIQPARREKMIESLKEQIKAAEERDKKITEQIGPIGFSDNSKTSGTSKLPGAHSDEAVRYQVGKAQIESDQGLIENFKAKLAGLESPEAGAKYAVEAKRAADALAAAEAEAKKQATRVQELEREIAEKSKSNTLENAADAMIGSAEAHTRDTNAGAKIHDENVRTLNQDVETISNYSKSDTVNPQAIAKAANAISELQSLLASHTELFQNLINLGSSVKDIAAAQIKVQKETALAKQIAQQALDHSNNH